MRTASKAPAAAKQEADKPARTSSAGAKPSATAKPGSAGKESPSKAAKEPAAKAAKDPAVKPAATVTLKPKAAASSPTKADTIKAAAKPASPAKPAAAKPPAAPGAKPAAPGTAPKSAVRRTTSVKKDAEPARASSIDASQRSTSKSKLAADASRTSSSSTASRPASSSKPATAGKPAAGKQIPPPADADKAAAKAAAGVKPVKSNVPTTAETSAAAAAAASGGAAKPPQTQASRKSLAGSQATEAAAELVKPDNQLQLTDAELAEEVAKMLVTTHPDLPRAGVRYALRERAWKPEPATELTMMHYQADGWLVNRATDEGARLAKAAHELASSAPSAESSVADRRLQHSASTASTSSRKTAAMETESLAAEPSSLKVLRNQFNFTERGCQTASYLPQERATNTEAPQTASTSGSCSQWGIFDTYLEDQDRQRAQEEAAKAKAAAGKAAAAKDSEASETVDPDQDAQPDVLHAPAMAGATKVLERMSAQVQQLEIAMDLQYWDDIMDAYEQHKGSLLPLWKFYTDHARRKQVTAMAWNPDYLDMFAAAFGSFDFQRQGSGLVACFSLKNPGHPEYLFTTPSGAMSVDWHPQHSSLLAVGCYNGSVHVFDVRLKGSTPLYSSVPGAGQHRGPVWGLKWSEAEASKALSFISVAADGRVALWMLSKNQLAVQDVLSLSAPAAAAAAAAAADAPGRDGDDKASSTASGLCFDFHKAQDHLFLVGTDGGKLHRCSTAYTSEYLTSYMGHDMAVYAVRWNTNHARTFVSASADWTVKLWDSNLEEAVLSFDLGAPVGDVAWAPFSSTLFAAATEDGRVVVYDLTASTSEPVCEQATVQQAQLTRLAFNPRLPVLLVGDDKGCVTSFKLSPNLRKDLTASTQAAQAKAASASEAAAAAPAAAGAPATDAAASSPAAGPSNGEQVAKLDRVIDIALKGHIQPVSLDKQAVAASA